MGKAGAFVTVISLGPTATVLAYDLTKEGYQALDLGQLAVRFTVEFLDLLGTQHREGLGCGGPGLAQVERVAHTLGVEAVDERIVSRLDAHVEVIHEPGSNGPDDLAVEVADAQRHLLQEAGQDARLLLANGRRHLELGEPGGPGSLLERAQPLEDLAPQALRLLVATGGPVLLDV